MSLAKDVTLNASLRSNSSNVLLKSDVADLDVLLQSDTRRSLFAAFLKKYNNASDNLLTLYLICCCFQNRIEDRKRMKQILEKTYVTCFGKNELPHLSADLKQKLGECLQKATYNECVFAAVKKELKSILENEYFPEFVRQHVAPNQTDQLQQHQQTSEQTGRNVFKNLLDSQQKQIKESHGSFIMPASVKDNMATKLASKNSKTSTCTSSTSSLCSSVSSHSTKSNPQLLQSKLNKEIKTPSKLGAIQREQSKQLEETKSEECNEFNLVLPATTEMIDTANIRAGKLSEPPLSVVNPEKFFEMVSNKLEKLQVNNTTNTSNNQSVNTNKASSKLKTISNNSLPVFSACKNSKISQNVHKKGNANISSNENFAHHQAEHIYETIEHANDFQVPSHKENKQNKHFTIKSSTPLNKTLPNRFGEMQRVVLNSTHMDKKSGHHHHHHHQNANTTSNHSHHFYKITSSSKEVDIDTQSLAEFGRVKSHKHQTTSHAKHPERANSNQSLNQVNLMSTRHESSEFGRGNNAEKLRNAASIERVNNWLGGASTGSTQKLNKHEVQASAMQPNNSLVKSSNTVSQNTNCISKVKTTVAYYMPGEDLAYISQFSGTCLTLAQFKHLITKKGKFRYFFKTKTDLLDEECIVFEEVTDDNQSVPMFNNKVIAKVEI